MGVKVTWNSNHIHQSFCALFSNFCPGLPSAHWENETSLSNQTGEKMPNRKSCPLMKHQNCRIKSCVMQDQRKTNELIMYYFSEPFFIFRILDQDLNVKEQSIKKNFSQNYELQFKLCTANYVV